MGPSKMESIPYAVMDVPFDARLPAHLNREVDCTISVLAYTTQGIARPLV
jgi:hypothetical protein